MNKRKLPSPPRLVACDGRTALRQISLRSICIYSGTVVAVVVVAKKFKGPGRVRRMNKASAPRVPLGRPRIPLRAKATPFVGPPSLSVRICMGAAVGRAKRESRAFADKNARPATTTARAAYIIFRSIFNFGIAPADFRRFRSTDIPGRAPCPPVTVNARKIRNKEQRFFFYYPTNHIAL